MKVEFTIPGECVSKDRPRFYMGMLERQTKQDILNSRLNIYMERGTISSTNKISKEVEEEVIRTLSRIEL
ncbi:hypothetical protein [Metaclostridioides mangenotii]|uniref:hypothetical protein n=1 Tax=Metaclostridioides mangenotii TaxID=1540 RepID=UPI000482CEBC|nr:hypothetical protein [Clostridioides mangenotii]